MDVDLTLPGAIPGLLRRGSPVVPIRSIVAQTADGRTLMLKPLLGTAGLAWQAPDSNGDVPIAFAEGACWLPASEMALDLTDATGRAHAAWWSAGAWHPEVRPTDYAACAWQLFPGQQPECGWWLRWQCRGDDGHTLTVPCSFTGARRPNIGSHHVPALADLDPDDPRLLPDGSRLVDALALQRVVLHVAGVTNG